MKYVMFVVGDPDHTEEDEAAAPDLETGSRTFVARAPT